MSRKMYEQEFWQFIIRTDDPTQQVLYARTLGANGGFAGYVSCESPCGETILTRYTERNTRMATPQEVLTAIQQHLQHGMVSNISSAEAACSTRSRWQAASRRQA